MSTTAADRMLTTVLRAYQQGPSPDSSHTDKIFGSTAHLLASLTNPLNLSLLTSHFLTASAIWEAPDGLQTCLRVLSIYYSASVHLHRDHVHNATLAAGELPRGSELACDSWARAVAKGADDRSARWQHMLVLTGILMGMEGDGRHALSRGLRSTLEHAVVKAANLALRDPVHAGNIGRGSVVLALTYALPLLSDSARHSLNCDSLLPATIEAMMGPEGFQNGDFVQAIANDVVPDRNIWWYPNSPSVLRLQRLESRPIAQNMGPVSQLAAFAVENSSNSQLTLQLLDDLVAFSTNLFDRWGRCSLSHLDITIEAAHFSPDVLEGPWARLWQLFKKILYAVAVVLQAVVARALLDPRLRNNATAPLVAARTLHTLRNLAFVSTRQGGDAFQVYTFTYNTALDTLTRFPDACATFLREALPPLPSPESRPPSPLVQALTLFYLNTAEHAPLALPTPAAEALIITPATAHLAPACWLASPANLARPSALTTELYEAAHACVLSVLSCPQHSETGGADGSGLTATLIPFYIDLLLASFPTRLSARQFRLAFRSIMQIVAPPFPIAAAHPGLGETLVEMVRFRAVEGGASPRPLPPSSSNDSHNQAHIQPTTANDASHAHVAAPGQQQEVPLSEQNALLLALVDALPYLPLAALPDWLTRAATSLRAIADLTLRAPVRDRLCEVLGSPEMDVERAAIGVAWWGTWGGRDLVWGGDGVVTLTGAGGPSEQGSGSGEEDGQYMMSGGLGERSRL